MKNAFWNPYATMPALSRRSLGLIAVITLLAVWSAISLSGLVMPFKLSAPWKVLSAL